MEEVFIPCSDDLKLGKTFSARLHICHIHNQTYTDSWATAFDQVSMKWIMERWVMRHVFLGSTLRVVERYRMVSIGKSL